jgi:hypothetical protein
VSTSPFSGSSTVGRADKGSRSDAAVDVRTKGGRRTGELDRIPVLEVGMGVGYLRRALRLPLPLPLPVFWRFSGRGRPGDDESGSNAGSREGADRFCPAAGGEEGIELLSLCSKLEGLGSGRVGSVEGNAPSGRGEAWAIVLISTTAARQRRASHVKNRLSGPFHVLEANGQDSGGKMSWFGASIRRLASRCVRDVAVFPLTRVPPGPSRQCPDGYSAKLPVHSSEFKNTRHKSQRRRPAKVVGGCEGEESGFGRG